MVVVVVAVAVVVVAVLVLLVVLQLIVAAIVAAVVVAVAVAVVVAVSPNSSLFFAVSYWIRSQSHVAQKEHPVSSPRKVAEQTERGVRSEFPSASTCTPWVGLRSVVSRHVPKRRHFANTDSRGEGGVGQGTQGGPERGGEGWPGPGQTGEGWPAWEGKQGARPHISRVFARALVIQ